MQQFTQPVLRREKKKDIENLHNLTGQWAYNSSPEPDKYTQWEIYDDITCLVLELGFIYYSKGLSSSKIVPINNSYNVDFSKLI